MLESRFQRATFLAQSPQRSGGENSRGKVQNVVTDRKEDPHRAFDTTVAFAVNATTM